MTLIGRPGGAVAESAGQGRWLTWLDIPAARPAASAAGSVREVLGAGFTHAAESGYRVRGAAAFEAGGAVDVMEPCSVLAELTGQAIEGGLERLTDDELIGVLRAARRVQSWQATVELAAVEELATRRAAEPHDGGPAPSERTSAELAAALTLTGRSADRLLDLAIGVARLPGVATGLSRGEIDLAKAAVFVDELAGLPWIRASYIAGTNVMAAMELTTGQLRARLRRAVLAADPEALRQRQRAARADARVEAWPEGSGNAGLAGRELPPGSVLLADKHLSALAKALRAAGMPGTADQVRAEVFVALLSGQSPEALLAARHVVVGAAVEPGDATGPGFAGPGDRGAEDVAGTPSWPAGPLGTLQLTLPLSTWLGAADRPGQVAGYGPVDAFTGRDLAAALTGRPGTDCCVLITTPDGQPLGHAWAATPPPRGQPRGDAGLPRNTGPPGTVPADVRAWLAVLKPEWLESGTCRHSRETAGYKPSRRLDHLLRIRNPTCTAPGCRRPAAAGDIDHVIPYHQGGRTCECNCHPLCRRHHRCKGSAGWRLEMAEPGMPAWRLPHGRTYVTRAELYPV